jgi:hypothetical protein
MNDLPLPTILASAYLMECTPQALKPIFMDYITKNSDTRTFKPYWDELIHSYVEVSTQQAQYTQRCLIK